MLFIQSSPSLAADDKKVTYDDQLAPIFRQRCSSCHNPTAKKADLDVTNYSEPDAGRIVRRRRSSRAIADAQPFVRARHAQVRTVHAAKGG